MKVITFLHVVINSVLVINVQNEFQVSFITIWSEHKEYLIARQIRNYTLFRNVFRSFEISDKLVKYNLIIKGKNFAYSNKEKSTA